MPKGERVQHGEAGREQISVLTGFKRSTRDAYLFRLSGRGYVEDAGGVIRYTEAGLTALGDYERLPTGTALCDWWLNRLPDGERAILAFVVAQYPNAADSDAITIETGYKRSTRDAYIHRLASKKLVLRERGGVKASEILFD